MKEGEDAVTQAIDPIHDQLLKLATQGDRLALGRLLESSCASIVLLVEESETTATNRADKFKRRKCS
jgi:hypothetical protein